MTPVSTSSKSNLKVLRRLKEQKVRHWNRLHFRLSVKWLAMEGPVKRSWCRTSDCCINCLSRSFARSPSVHGKIRRSNSSVQHRGPACHRVTQAEPTPLKWGDERGRAVLFKSLDSCNNTDLIKKVGMPLAGRGRGGGLNRALTHRYRQRRHIFLYCNFFLCLIEITRNTQHALA